MKSTTELIGLDVPSVPKIVICSHGFGLAVWWLQNHLVGVSHDLTINHLNNHMNSV